eukprot:1186551-Prorocentrum_minimum.AAC.1
MRPNLQAPTPQRPAPPPGHPPRRSKPSPPIATARATVRTCDPFLVEAHYQLRQRPGRPASWNLQSTVQVQDCTVQLSRKA